MKIAKAIRKQAATAERVAASTADTHVANQMRSLAQAFRTQAEIIKKNKLAERPEFDPVLQGFSPLKSVLAGLRRTKAGTTC